MLYVLPDYYPEFQCTADKCEDTCCAGWQIVIDEPSLRRYRAYRGPFRRRMLRSVLWRKEIFRQDGEKRCAFLNDRNLCDLYKNVGPDSLCRTCRLYPRHIEEYENVREISLSVSCPEANRLLLTRETPVKFVEFEREKEETYEEFDDLLYSELLDCRKVMLNILQNRDLPLKTRCSLVTGLAADMQKRFDEGNLFSFQELLERVAEAAQSGGKPVRKSSPVWTAERKMEAARADNFGWVRDVFCELHGFECLKEDWPLWIAETEDWLYGNGPEAYERTEREFLEWLRRDRQDWQIPFEQLLVYFTFIYFCGAVYDGEILASAQAGSGACVADP